MKICLLEKGSFRFWAILIATITSQIFARNAYAQGPVPEINRLSVLFIGDSYTSTNDLHLLTKEIANSVGDTLNADIQTYPDHTFKQHSVDAGTITKLSAGVWDYVILQEQGSLPALDDTDVETDVFPYARALDSMIRQYNPCGKTMFFRTWGHRLGDIVNCPTFPPVCTYEGMDSMLAMRYEQMAVDNRAVISPVGEVFKEIRRAMPGLILYAPDNVHPSNIGSYAAALTFYTVLFQKDPTLVPYRYSLSPVDASMIKVIVKMVVYDQLMKHHIGEYMPHADFSASISGNKADFDASASLFATHYNWDFGDGNTSDLQKPSNVYSSFGTYTVRLIVDDCLSKDTTTQTITIEPSFIADVNALQEIRIFPNPTDGILHIQTSLNSEDITIQVLDMVGALVTSLPALSNRDIDLSGAPTGIYFVKIEDKESGQYIIRKFVKQ